ncbi:MAG TPA: HEAT repeat domain-containing protein [Gemmatales bacterium]|nr:HEAT repeat domain-containing protein [Gemmatales bacterium]
MFRMVGVEAGMVRHTLGIGLTLLLGTVVAAGDPTPWSAGLRAPEASVRLAAVLQLSSAAKTGPWTSEQGLNLAGDLLRLVQDEDVRVRAAAVRALAHCRVPGLQSAPAWTHAMSDADVEIRRAAVESVGQHLEGCVTAALQSAIPQVRCQLLDQTVRDARAVTPVLRAALTDMRADVRRLGLEALHRGLTSVLRIPSFPQADETTDTACLVHLRETLPAWVLEWTLLMPEVAPLTSVGPVPQRVLAAEIVEHITRLERQVVEWCPQAVDGTKEARVLAAARTRLVHLLPVLGETLKRAPTPVRLAILGAFEAQPSNVPDCRPAVVEQLAYPQPAVRWAAVRVLAQWGPASTPDEWQQLNHLLDDVDLDVRQAATRALRVWAERQMREQSAPIVSAGGVAAEEALAHLRDSLTAAVRGALHGEAGEQLAALRAVHAAGTEGIVVLPELRLLLGTGPVSVRRYVPQVLVGIGSAAKELIPDLEHALSDDDAEVRAAAARALLMLRGS